MGTALLASGCSLGTGTRSSREQQAPATITSLTASSPFYIAHRGGGGNWPEMTAHAYEQATKISGLQALEVSVCITSDGVLVCSHDPTTDRVTGRRYRIAEESWATLADVKVHARETTDPAQAAQPLARFDEILERYIDRYVLFVEPKVGPAEAPLLRRLSSTYSSERIVWKQPLVNTGFAAAKQAGFGTWAYVLNEPAFLGANLRRLADPKHVDMLGVPVRAPEALLRSVSEVAQRNEQKVIAWAITSASERDIALGFGADGLMTSNVAELVPQRSASATG